MKSLRLSVLAAALVLGACSSATPTEPASAAVSFDEGPGSGGGTATSDTGGTTTSSDSTPQRGGGMLGSGN
ncbi:MAG TPA: hypothetical protein VF006_28040 [Longimicrobium sp.]